MKTKYRCEFLFKGSAWSVYSFDGPSAFSNGFWINANYQLTTGLDCKYWIPPTVIEYVEKIRIED